MLIVLQNRCKTSLCCYHHQCSLGGSTASLSTLHIPVLTVVPSPLVQVTLPLVIQDQLQLGLCLPQHPCIRPELVGSSFVQVVHIGRCVCVAAETKHAIKVPAVSDWELRLVEAFDL